MELVTGRCGKVCGEIVVPGDKSISHRALFCGALAEGETDVTGFLPSEDCFSTLQCLQKLGVEIGYSSGTDHLHIKGVGLHGFQPSKELLDAGNSGTTARLLMGILAGQPFSVTIDGDASLRQRPMRRVIKPLSLMGADFAAAKNNNKPDMLPLTIKGGNLKAINYKLPVASAQVKSALLFAALYADGVSTVEEPAYSRDHTEKMLSFLGVNIRHRNRRIYIQGKQKMFGRQLVVPGDFSSAAFFLVAAALLPGSELLIKEVGVNPTRTGLLDVLQEMGAELVIENRRIIGGEPVADLFIKGSKPLQGVSIGKEIIPRLIDEIPVLSVAAACAATETVINDAQELRVKETDRLHTITQELRKMGAEIMEKPDGLIIKGRSRLKGAVCDSHGDHRIAMSLAIAGAVAEGETLIRNAECINISFPGFVPLYRNLFH